MPNEDPETQRVEADRFLDLAGLMRVDMRPPTIAAQAQPPVVEPVQRGQTLPTASVPEAVDNPQVWTPKITEQTLRSLAEVQLPTPPRQRPVPDHNNMSAPEAESMAPAAPKRQRMETLARFLQHEDTGTYALTFVLGAMGHLAAQQMLPAWGVRALSFGSVGAVLTTVALIFLGQKLEREFCLAFLFALGIMIAKRFL